MSPKRDKPGHSLLQASGASRQAVANNQADVIALDEDRVARLLHLRTHDVIAINPILRGWVTHDGDAEIAGANYNICCTAGCCFVELGSKFVSKMVERCHRGTLLGRRDD